MKPATFTQYAAAAADALDRRYREAVSTAKTDADGRLLPDPRRVALAKARRWAHLLLDWLDAMRDAGEREVMFANADGDGDGRVTVSDLERLSARLLDSAADWARDPEMMDPEMDISEEVVAADRVHRLLGELRGLEADMLRECLAGQITIDALREVLDFPFGKDQKADDSQSMETSRGLGGGLVMGAQQIGPWLGALALSRAGRLCAQGYVWRVLNGGWKRGGVRRVDEAAQRVEADSDREAVGWPYVADKRRLGDGWARDRNCPSEAPRTGTGRGRLTEDIRRWARVTLPAAWRFLGGGTLFVPRAVEECLRAWWDALVRYIEAGRIREGDPLWGHRNDIFLPYGGGTVLAPGRISGEGLAFPPPAVRVPAVYPPVQAPVPEAWKALGPHGFIPPAPPLPVDYAPPPPPLPPPVIQVVPPVVGDVFYDPIPPGVVVPTPAPSPLNPVNAPGGVDGQPLKYGG